MAANNVGEISLVILTDVPLGKVILFQIFAALCTRSFNDFKSNFIYAGSFFITSVAANHNSIMVNRSNNYVICRDRRAGDSAPFKYLHCTCNLLRNFLAFGRCKPLFSKKIYQLVSINKILQNVISRLIFALANIPYNVRRINDVAIFEFFLKML